MKTFLTEVVPQNEPERKIQVFVQSGSNRYLVYQNGEEISDSHDMEEAVSFAARRAAEIDAERDPFVLSEAKEVTESEALLVAAQSAVRTLRRRITVGKARAEKLAEETVSRLAQQYKGIAMDFPRT